MARRRSAAARIGTGLAHVVLMAGALVMVMPMLWMIATSLKPPSEIALWPPVFFPGHRAFRTTRVRSKPLHSGDFS